MIMNLSAGDNTSEEVAELLSAFMNEVTETLTAFKSEVNTMLMEFTNDVDSDITALNSSVTALSTNLSTVKTDVATVKSNVSTLSTTVSGIPKGAVKSVQRGTVTGGVDKNIDITISTVNPSKCLVILGVSEIAGEGYNMLPIPYSLTSTKLTITQSYISFTSSNNEITVSWQVIEFY